MLTFLSITTVWNSEGEFILDGYTHDSFLSIAEEFKSQTGNNLREGKGTVRVEKIVTLLSVEEQKLVNSTITEELF